MATAIDFSKKSIVIITGPSQGIGQKISEIVGSKCKDGSKIVLITRSEAGLIESRNKILKLNNNLLVTTYSQDLSKPNIREYDEIFDQILQDGSSYVEEPNINILSYCPGPVNTAMFNEVIENAENAELKTQFKDIKANNILSTEQTLEKLFNILESRDLIDHFDGKI